MSDMESNDELIKHVRDPLFCGSALCFTLADRLQTLQADLETEIAINQARLKLDNQPDILDLYNGVTVEKLKAENEALKNSDFNPTFCRILIKELTTEAARYREALENIAKQMTTQEIIDEDLEDDGDIECGYDYIIKEAREALKPKEKNT